jgi:hypothetical protein
MAVTLRRTDSYLDAVAAPAPEAGALVRLRRITPEREPVELETEADFEDLVEDAGARTGGLRTWLTGAALVGALSAYPAMMVAASDIGDSIVAGDVDRSQWTVPWAGAAVGLLQHQYRDVGWASDAAAWTPMAVLTAKPAYQSALADAVGDFLDRKAGPEGSGGAARGDLAAAARLVDADSTGVQLRAATDALISFDRRLQRQGGLEVTAAVEAGAAIALVGQWAEQSKDELARSANSVNGNPFDGDAIQSVYAAKGRAAAAHAFLSTLSWPDDANVRAARNSALETWRAAAEFHPVLVLNASPESTLLGNHPTAMGFLVDRAQSATDAYAVAVREAEIGPPR